MNWPTPIDGSRNYATRERPHCLPTIPMRSTQSNSRCHACRGLHSASKSACACLRQQVEADEAAEIAKRRQALRERFAKKLAEADAAAVELQETVARAVDALSQDHRHPGNRPGRMADLRRHHNAAAGALEGAALSGSAVKALLAFEFYRISRRPIPRRRSWRAAATEPARSGVAARRSTTQSLRDQAVCRCAAPSAFAVEAMGSKLDPLRALNVGEAVASVDGERTPAEQRLAALLKQQAEARARHLARGRSANTWPSSPNSRNCRVNRKQKQPNNDRRTSPSRARSVYVIARHSDRPTRRNGQRHTMSRATQPLAPFRRRRPVLQQQHRHKPRHVWPRLNPIRNGERACSPAAAAQVQEFQNLVALAASSDGSALPETRD